MIDLTLGEYEMMNYCISCRDTLTGEVGDFLFDEKAKLERGVFEAVSPVFTNLIEFYKWARENNVTLRHN